MRKVTSEVLSALQRLGDLGKIPEPEFLADPHKVGSAKYSLIVAIEGTLDLCNHVISKNGFRTPEDYADTFRVPEERGVFDAEFTGALSRWRGSETGWCIFTGRSTMQKFTGLS